MESAASRAPSEHAGRNALWQRLAAPVDLLILGAGITGAGIARVAARAGLRVALVDRADIGGGTSSRSSKLIHGGFRYLEHYQFGLVFESVSERRALHTSIAPHLVTPLGFLFPLYDDSRIALGTLRLGMWAYDALSLFRSPRLHRSLDPAELTALVPSLRTDGLRGGPLYFDCATDDARLTLENALDAAAHGALVLPWCRVTGLEHDEHGQVSGARLEDTLSGQTGTARALAVVNATGPWTDELLALDAPGTRPLLRPTKGVHVTLDAARLALPHAIVCLHPDDGRILFAVPWGDRTYVGTTDTDLTGTADDLVATHADVRYLLRAVQSQFPSLALGEDDVCSTWCGIRPLLRPHDPGSAVTESQTSREHAVLVRGDGLVSIAGGKLTTYRRMARDVMRTLFERLGARRVDPQAQPRADLDDDAPLPGAVDWPAGGHTALADELRRRAGAALGAAEAALLAHTYGTRARELADWIAEDPSLAAPIVPGRPELVGQVDFAARRELATRLSDVLARRTQLFFRDRAQGLDAARAVAARLAGLLGWSDERTTLELEDYAAEVRASRAWREPTPSLTDAPRGGERAPRAP